MIVTIAVASVDLAMNLPVYLIDICENFVPLKELLPDDIVRESLAAAAYILYHCQYLLILLYVHLLTRQMHPSCMSGSPAVGSKRSGSLLVGAENPCRSVPQLTSSGQVKFITQPLLVRVNSEHLISTTEL